LNYGPNWSKGLKRHRFKSIEQLKTHILSHEPTLYLGAKTSTVLPEPIEAVLRDELALGELSLLPKTLELQNPLLIVRGPVSWKEAREFLRTRSLDLQAWPTEEEAFILSGAATSATGERSFGHGAIREHLEWIEFLDSQGELRRLEKNLFLSEHPAFLEGQTQQLLKAYQTLLKSYEGFKNPPFPRLEREIDLLVGTEGQLGVIVGVGLRVMPLKNTVALFLSLPHWRESSLALDKHMELHQFLQENRSLLYTAEFFDEACLKFLNVEALPFKKGDTVCIELEEEKLERLLEIIPFDQEQIFCTTESKARDIRLSIPRQINEHNARLGVVKVGTDIQTSPRDFRRLLEAYRELARESCDSVLFGHFGDSHLHFNFLPTAGERGRVMGLINQAIEGLKGMTFTPFAEHGVGLIKFPLALKFYSAEVLELFKHLKREFDPHSQFFPSGYMMRAIREDYES
jgi:FAD/FMN-containing dehydrogenase